MRFAKWHGLGNDYLLIERGDLERPLSSAAVARLCDCHTGVGADGVLEIINVDGARAEVVIWNPDGSTAELSGNGTRIASSWLARRAEADQVVVVVGPRTVEARVLENGLVEQRMGRVQVDGSEKLDLDDEQIDFTPVSVGNPHAVIRRDPDPELVRRLGPLVEHHARFAGRTNVELVRVDGDHELTVGVWERGAGETRSSGTGSCAAVAAAIANGWCRSPVTVRLPGGTLEVALNGDGEATLTGPAQEICSGVIARELLDEFPA